MAGLGENVPSNWSIYKKVDANTRKNIFGLICRSFQLYHPKQSTAYTLKS